MNRIFVVYNPRSSQYAAVKKEVLGQQRKLKGYVLGKYEVEPTDVDQNAAKFAKILKDGDLVISAGGDATGVIASNAILRSGKDVTLAVLPYGNFNDLSRTLGVSDLKSFFEGGPERGNARFSAGHPWTLAPWDANCRGRNVRGKRAGRTRPEKKDFGRLYPLEIYVDGKFFRYATCYVTIGMMGEAVKLYDSEKMRKKLKKNFGRKVTSYTALAGWYFKNRHKKIFLPEFKLNGKLQSKKVSDYCAINGKYMARIMKGEEDYKDPKVFRSKAAKLTSFWRLFDLMAKSIISRVPGTETTGDILEFTSPATVELQAEGEYRVFENIKTIEVKKGKKCLKVITN